MVSPQETRRPQIKRETYSARLRAE